MGRRQVLVLVAVILCCSCAPPTVNRPLEGAAPVIEGGAGAPRSGGTGGTGPPPTLSPPGPAAVGSPSTGDTIAVGPTASPSPSPEPGYVIGATDGRGANLRDAPGTSSRVLMTLAEGTAVEAFGDTTTADGQSWRKIRGANREGWVLSVVVRRR